MSIFIVALIAWPTFAQTRPPVMTVWSKDSNDHLRATYPKERIEYIDQGSMAADYAEEGYLPPNRRDQLFQKVGVTKALAAVDDLDKDMLVMGLHNANPRQIKAIARKYPMLTDQQIRRLKVELGRMK